MRNAPANMGAVRRDCTAYARQISGPELMERKAGETLLDR
jgi:hypothetical protein